MPFIHHFYDKEVVPETNLKWNRVLTAKSVIIQDSNMRCCRWQAIHGSFHYSDVRNPDNKSDTRRHNGIRFDLTGYFHTTLWVCPVYTKAETVVGEFCPGKILVTLH